MINIKQNLTVIEQQIAQACQKNSRKNKEITLIAVSKTKPTTMIEQAFLAGQRDFGENYLQEALTKIEYFSTNKNIIWHFIGPIQSNKTKPIAENFAWVQSVDREKIALRLNAQRPTNLAPLNICIQVNIDNETTKSGVLVDDLFELAKIIEQCERLTLRGIMAVPNRSVNLQSYQRLQQLFVELQQCYPHVDTLSVGMSNDLTQAIAHGSTMVRVGSAIFGERDYTAKENL